MTAIYIGVEIIAVGIFWIAYGYGEDDGDPPAQLPITQWKDWR